MRLRQAFTRLFLEVAQRDLRSRPTWQNGYVSSWNVYAPGPLLDYQVDASSLFSPQAYEEHFLDADREILGAFDYSITHLHAVGLHLLDVLLKVQEMKAIEINVDRETGVWEKDHILACCRKVQQHGRCLVVNGELSDEEAREFTGTLSPRGLAICYWNPQPEGAVTTTASE
jgi:hypothetical protein